MKFKVRMVVEATYEVKPENYGTPTLTDPQEMLAIDIEGTKDDAETFVGVAIDEVEGGNPNYRFEVTGEVVEE